MPAYRLKCKNEKCGSEFHRFWPQKEFETLQYNSEGGTYKGIGCFACGFPNMIVMKSNKSVKDGFQPGFQRNIMKHCNTYAEYKAHLKNMGIIEIGYEETEDRKHAEPFFTPNLIRKLNQKHSLNLSDRNIEGINKEIEKETA